MEPAEVGRLLLGISVKIGRSDGRVHNATVKDFNPTKSAVHVEWNEKNVTKGKEIELTDVFHLNAELIEHLQAPVESTSKAAPKAEKKPELPTRASKIPAPSERPRRMTTRQTCLFQPPALPSAGSVTTAEDAPGQDLPSSAVTRSVGLPGYQRKQTKPPPPSLQPGRDVAHGGETLKNVPVPPANRRVSRVAEVNKTSSKRLSLSTKNSEIQIKKGKYGDMSRPNKHFYQMIEEYRETVEKVPLSLSDPVELHRICVCVRKRPLNKKELSKKEIDVVTVPGRGVLLFHEPKQKVDLTKYLDNQRFCFDYSFDDDSTNDLIYRFTARPLVNTVFEGGRATCFAYGQTGSGKTHTMGGDFSGKAQNSSKGIYALAAHDVFSLLQQRRYADLGLEPYVTFFEIYNGKVFDLLNKKSKLRVLEDESQQVQVVGLLEMPVSSADDVIKLIEKGSACRTSGQTFANTNSSRSHAILQVILRRGKHLHGKFSLVDLAGNERGTDVSSNDRKTMVETAEINRSLLALKECIRSLGQNSEHIPFRMSKLTQVLRDSFIGENSRTCMIAMISPGMSSCDYTLNTLRYADRVKELNGISKGTVQESSSPPGDLQDSYCSLLEEESMRAEFGKEIQISELEEMFYDDLQGASELAKAMEHETFDVVNSLPEMSAYVEKLQGSLQALRSAVESLKARSLGTE
ncbi:kinesin-like protein KIF2C isoform X2 [Brachyhypopomus gauderio]|uniref:kinesin-like protein KIF2C isoform X2 n=1 Tax=Brachyhypopomus gauderio TaxID=698409 RepID=UPI004042FE25